MSDYTPNPLTVLASGSRHMGGCYGRNFCGLCGAHASHYTPDAPLLEQRPEAEAADLWIACDNADCAHAQGEELYDNALPYWVVDRATATIPFDRATLH